MASWRVPGSILKASGLDFIGSGLDFQLAGLVLEGCQRSPKLQRSWPESPRSGQATGCLPSIAKPLWPIHTTPRSSEGGGAAVVPPQGGFNPPPTDKVGHGVLDSNQQPQHQTPEHQHRMAYQQVSAKFSCFPSL